MTPNTKADGVLKVKGKTVSLLGSELEGGSVDITADILTIIDLKETERKSHHSDDSGVMVRTIKDKGYVKESEVASAIKTNSTLILNNKDVTKQLSKSVILDSASKLQGLSTIQLNQVKATLNNKEWDETQKMLSKTGSLIVQAVATYLTTGIGSGLTSGISNAALKQATGAAINSLTRQVTVSVLESAITGNGLKLDIDELVKNAVKSGVSAGIDTGVISQLDEVGLSDSIQGDVIQTLTGSASQSALYGTPISFIKLTLIFKKH